MNFIVTAEEKVILQTLCQMKVLTDRQ